MIKDIVTGLNAYVDGRSYIGEVVELVLPKLTPKLREYSAGGLGAPVDIPTGELEKLESTVTLAGVNPELIKGFGVTLNSIIPLTFRGHTHSEDGSEGTVVVVQRGLIKELDWGTWKPGEDSPLKATLSLHYYRYEYQGAVLIEADLMNYKLIVNGKDQLANFRASLIG
ncbi:phage major tail tube protein [Candidatus Sororendozoicomonas aggregata]|uniref:phage major tail tube protein n=1 Tax=Candidatus Sororendozoicomonas aggregata TaxID=3073239 RepID=UPI002ECFCB86